METQVTNNSRKKERRNRHKKNRKHINATSLRNPVRAYVSQCCNAPATKPPLVARRDYREATPNEFLGLGKWKCELCKKHCKVKVTKPKVEVVA